MAQGGAVGGGGGESSLAPEELSGAVFLEAWRDGSSQCLRLRLAGVEEAVVAVDLGQVEEKEEACRALFQVGRRRARSGRRF